MATALQANTGLAHGTRSAPEFHIHALRLKIYEDMDRLINHVDSSVSGLHYDGTDVEDLRRPLQTIASQLERLMKEAAVKVLNSAKSGVNGAA